MTSFRSTLILLALGVALFALSSDAKVSPRMKARLSANYDDQSDEEYDSSDEQWPHPHPRRSGFTGYYNPG